ncbi:necrosis-and ethylene-inducing protein-like protein 1 precursor [Alternaria alternata]|nr:necrosis-and ethylene-inducing protein-like protein 1 precursor [Alternaria alternata]
MHFATILSAFAAVSGVLAAPAPSQLDTRAVVPHDSLNPIRTRLQGGAIGRAILRFQPLLHIAHGCQPYTAVDDNGNTSGGLQDTGNVSAGCRDQNKGQTYARAAWHKGKFAIMYAWYWPKDQPTAGNVVGGHRHDWESVVVWIDNPANANPRILGAAASGHGGYSPTTRPNIQGNNVKVEYFVRFPYNHATQFTNTVGRTYWISDWDAMPTAARQALAPKDLFGKANVPFRNDVFASNLDKAYV